MYATILYYLFCTFYNTLNSQNKYNYEADLPFFYEINKSKGGVIFSNLKLHKSGYVDTVLCHLDFYFIKNEKDTFVKFIAFVNGKLYYFYDGEQIYYLENDTIKMFYTNQIREFLKSNLSTKSIYPTIAYNIQNLKRNNISKFNITSDENGEILKLTDTAIVENDTAFYKGKYYFDNNNRRHLQITEKISTRYLEQFQNYELVFSRQLNVNNLILKNEIASSNSISLRNKLNRLIEEIKLTNVNNSDR